MIGKSISRYRILDNLGEGGMGQVFLADDTTLNRKVALKFLPEAFASDPERMARFEREAKLLASLNHPNIAGIYGLEQADGNRFLVLEYVEGETLQARLSKGALQLEDALELCRQIAEGLEAAHEKGVIHRDLKPANVMITADERVKILDFGLAKAFSDDTQSIDSSQSPTLTEAMTRPGVILGTAAYMSPEQAKGKSVDKRADIWAFGCILYECLTGKKAFEGETVTETLASVIKEEPDIEKAPLEVRLLLQQCLVKDRKKRLRDIGDAMALFCTVQGVTTDLASEFPPSKKSMVAWAITIVSLLGMLAFGILYLSQTPTEMPEIHFNAETPPSYDYVSFALSPDGLHLVYAASKDGQNQLWLRELANVTPRPLDGTEGAILPFWSHDSRSIGFFAEGKLKKTEITGGIPQDLADAPYGLGGTWNQDNVIVFAPSQVSPLFRIPASGEADPKQITELNSQVVHFNPQFLPDGNRLIYHAYGKEGGLYLTSLDSAQARLLSRVMDPVRYAFPGYLLFLRQNILNAKGFDIKSVNLSNDTYRITDSVVQNPYYGIGGFSVSETGLLAHRKLGGEIQSGRLAWFDRSGNEAGTILVFYDENLLDPELSPDNDRVAVRIAEGQQTDIYLIETASGNRIKFTTYESHDGFPIWSPSGDRIIFGSYHNIWNIYKKVSSSADKEEPFFEDEVSKFPSDWSPDGKNVLYIKLDPENNRDLWVRPISEDKPEPKPFANTKYEETNGQFSPDGRWVAYEFKESGKFEICVKQFPGPGRVYKISNGGGSQPRWNPKGGELFYIDPEANLMAVSIQVEGDELKHGNPKSLFMTKIRGRGTTSSLNKIQYDVSKDGQRFLINVTDEEPVTNPITIITNWTKLLEK
jgi:serine/threonine protein kinase